MTSNALDAGCVETWLAQARDGDAEAFGAVCEALTPRLLRQAFFLCRDEAQAEDLAQDTMVEAWKSLHRYNGSCQFFTWLCAIMLHRHHNLRRRQRPLALSSLGSDDAVLVSSLADQASDPRNNPDNQALSAEQAAHLRDCLEQLSPAHREVVYLRFYVDQSLQSIALATGCSLGTAKSRLFYALEHLRAMAANQVLVP